MRKLWLTMVLAASAATTAAAQNSWQPEIGFRTGFARVKPAGTSATDHADLFGIPSFSAGGAIPGNAAVFVVLPTSPKMAIEPSFALSQFTDATGGGILNLVTLGLRMNYALSPKFYAAAGGGYTFTYSGIGASQLGLQVGAGYRLKLSSVLNGRIEANWTAWGKTEDLPPQNVYAVELGISTPVSRGTGRTAARGGSSRSWSPALGLRGGYSQVHIVSVGDAALFTGPGFTNLLAVAGLGVPSSMFAILPIGQRWALEPSFDLLRAQSGGFTQAGAHLGARLNYAVTDNWYGAGGINIIYVKSTGADAGMSTGAEVAWGYRFPLMGALGGRVETSYIAMAHNDKLAAVANGASNTFSVTFGVTVPLK